jgi:tetratricopeptide (TPR) repeat protein
MISDFPVWGTGFASLDYVEPIYRTDPADAGRAYQHAHNEYLEALIEGGLVRLALSLLAIFLIFRAGYRAFHRLEDSPAGALLLGGLVGFTTLVLHSFVDFGVHIPAITLLAAVLCAHLTALAQADETRSRPLHGPPLDPVRNRFRLLRQGLLAVLAAACLCFLGWLLVNEASKAVEVRRLRQAAHDLGASPSLADREECITSLEAASRLDPENARLHFEVADKHVHLFDVQTDNHKHRDGVRIAAASVLLGNPASLRSSGPAGIHSLLFLAGIQEEQRKKATTELARRHLVPAVRHYLQARDLCPTRAKVHMEIAFHLEVLEKADARRVYVERALFLDPAHPDLWYRAGFLALRDRQWEQAWKDWRRSLELSDLFLEKILDRSVAYLDPQQLADRLLPPRPRLLVAAASYLYPAPDSPQRRPFFERARALYQGLPGPWPAEDLHLKGVVAAALGHAQESLDAYREALLQEPQQLTWRFELAHLLFERHQLQEARKELLTILTHQPRHGAALELLARLEKGR